MEYHFSEIEQAIEEIAKGEFVIVLDNFDRENEGDLIIAAEKMTNEKMTFLLQHTSGIVCTPMSGERLDALHLPLMVSKNTESQKTAFTVSVDVKEGTTTGISSSDRTKTVLALANQVSTSDWFRKPGHIFPLRACEGGVLKRPGHTEAAVDLALLAGLKPVSVLCEIVNSDYSMARTPQLVELSQRKKIPLITISDLIRYRCKSEPENVTLSPLTIKGKINY